VGQALGLLASNGLLIYDALEQHAVLHEDV
jgi:hypothetical protein